MRQAQVVIETQGQGLYNITTKIEKVFPEGFAQTGLLHLFLQHTSASLLIQENSDPTAQQDIEEFIERLVPPNQNWHRHTVEGPDDTTSHLKSSLTPTQLTIPIVNAQLGLGTWQGIYLWEHRELPHRRKIIVTEIVGPTLT